MAALTIFECFYQSKKQNTPFSITRALVCHSSMPWYFRKFEEQNYSKITLSLSLKSMYLHCLVSIYRKILCILDMVLKCFCSKPCPKKNTFDTRKGVLLFKSNPSIYFPEQKHTSCLKGCVFLLFD